jgi:hypothetical protein
MAGSGSDRRKRNKRITVRFNDDEFTIVIRKADKAGLCVGSLIRNKVLDEPAPCSTRRPPIDRKYLAQLIGLLGETTEALRDHCKAHNIPPDNPYIVASFRDLSEMRYLCLITLGRNP